MKPTKWTSIRNSFDPFDPIPPDKLDEWFVERPDSPIKFLMRRLSPESPPQRCILVGQPHTGKSSELTKLAAELHDRNGDFVVRIDLTENADAEHSDPAKVLFLTGTAIFKVASVELPADRQPDRHLLERLTARLEAVAHVDENNRDFAIDLNEVLERMAAFGGKPAAPFVRRLVSFRFASGTDAELVRRTKAQPLIESLIDSLNAVIDDVQVKAGRRVVVIVDGLDKIQRPDLVALMFLERKYLAGVGCTVVYTGPLNLYYSTEFQRLGALFHIVPFRAVELYGRSNAHQINEDGCEFLRRVIHRRIQSLGLNPETIIVPSALDMLIQGGAGFPRDVVRLVRDSAVQTEINRCEIIGEREADESLTQLSRDLSIQVSLETQRLLQTIHHTHQRADDERFNALLWNRLVVAYIDKELWFDAHPLLWRKLEQ